jgi:hypothetical protein
VRANLRETRASDPVGDLIEAVLALDDLLPIPVR